MCQIKYLKEILKRFRMAECKPIGVPLDPKVKLQRNANGNVYNYAFSKDPNPYFMSYHLLW